MTRSRRSDGVGVFEAELRAITNRAIEDSLAVIEVELARRFNLTPPAALDHLERRER